MPGLDLWETILPRRVRLLIWEDNESTEQILESGRSPALRHLGRAHGVSLAWLHEQTAVEGIDVQDVDSSFQLADIFTKAFDSAAAWLEKLKLIDHVAFERDQKGRLRCQSVPCLLQTHNTWWWRWWHALCTCTSPHPSSPP